jgi:hypothetical protein
MSVSGAPNDLERHGQEEQAPQQYLYMLPQI